MEHISDDSPPGLIVLYGVNSLQNALSNSESIPSASIIYHPVLVLRQYAGHFLDLLDYPTNRPILTAAEFKNDPRNPNAGKPAH